MLKSTEKVSLLANFSLIKGYLFKKFTLYYIGNNELAAGTSWQATIPFSFV